MILIFVVAVLVGFIAFYQAVQGVFSALIMTILTIACAMLAFNYYEPLASMLYNTSPAYADGASLVALFALPLLGLRLLTDRFIPGNSLVGLWPDRIIGGLLGIITGEVCVGVLLVAMQMLPWGQTMLGYTAFKEDLSPNSHFAPFYPDEFAVGLANMLSAGSFKADPEHGYQSVHDDLLRELYCARNTGTDAKGNPLNGSTAVMPGTLKILNVCKPPDNSKFEWANIPDNPLLEKKDRPGVLWVVRASFDENARAQDDDDKLVRLAGTQFRLVGASGKSYYPEAYLTYGKSEKTDSSGKLIVSEDWKLVSAPVDKDSKIAQIGRLALSRPWGQRKAFNVDWVYRLPLNEKPSYLVFRRNALAEFSKKDAEKPAEVMPPTADALESPGTK